MGIEIDQETPEVPGEKKKLTFKDAVAADIDTVFFNELEHATLHTVDGKEVWIVTDENALKGRRAHWEGGAKQSFDSGLYVGDYLFYIRKEDYGPRPKVGKPLNLDKRNYSILAVEEDAGVYAMTLQRVRQ